MLPCLVVDQVDRPAIIAPEIMLGFLQHEGVTNEETIY